MPKGTLELFQLMLFGFLHLWWSLFLIKRQACNLNGSARAWFYLQAVMEFVLIKLQVFIINGGDGICDGSLAKLKAFSMICCFGKLIG